MTDYKDLSVEELRKELDAKGIKYESEDKKKDLIKLLESDGTSDEVAPRENRPVTSNASGEEHRDSDNKPVPEFSERPDGSY